MLQQSAALALPMESLEAFCQRHHLRRMWLFGSILGDNFTASSDVDVLVEFDPAHIPGWEFFLWADELAAIFEREVDLATPNSLHPQIREDVMQSARMIYERTG
jgi:predicted nucleotidyltransferase